ncbi:MAG: hypothetical protein ACPW60_10415 [Methylohalobius sp. ZOD2]
MTTSYEIWHTRLVQIGIAINLLFVVGLCFFPRQLLDFLSIPLEHLIWARASGMLLFIISVFYIPPTWDLKRYRAVAWFAIFPSRTFGATFFTIAVFVFGHPKGFLSIAIVDALIGLSTCYCLWHVTQAEAASGSPVSLK